MHWWGFEPGMGFGFGWIYMVIFWVLMIIGIIYLVKSITGGSSAGKDTKETAEDLLKKRFARGELNKDEFAEAMEVLRKHRNK